MSVKCLIYCCKAKPYLYRVGTENWWYNEGCYEPFAYMEGFDLYNKKQKENSTIKEGDIYTSIFHNLNGKIIASFDCEKVDYYQMEYHKNDLVMNDISIYDEFESKEWGHDCFKRVISNEYSEEEIANCELIKKSCLSFDELGKYVCPKNGIDNFYAIHISNLEIFDKPKELNEYMVKAKKDKNWIGHKYIALHKAPQNMCNVYDRFGNHYVLISIRPEHIAKILTGKKTIEVRKKVVNKLKELI